MNFFARKLPAEKIRLHIGPMLILLAATCVVYSRIAGHEFLLNWDDSRYVVDNEVLRSVSWENICTVFKTYYVGNYAPVQMLSYMLDYQLWGLWAGGFLLTNLFIHCLNGILTYRFFIRFHGERIVATAASAVFLLHPVQVEAVAWVSQRKTLLAMLFFLLAWEGYILYQEEGEKKRYYYIFSVAAFVAALLSKSVVVILPLVLMVYDLCFVPVERRVGLRDKIPYILAAGIVAIIALRSQSPDEMAFWGGGGGRTLGYHGGSALATFYTMSIVFCRYIIMLVWPVNLSAEYSPVIHYSIDYEVVIAFAILVILLLSGVKLFRMDRRYGFWVVFLLLGILPVSQIVPLVTMMNDRYLYFPMIGVSILFAGGFAYPGNRFFKCRSVILLSLFVVQITTLSILSFRQVGYWRNAVMLWGNAVVQSPGSYLAWERLGEAYHLSSVASKAEALQAYGRALEINPKSEITLYNLGVLYTGSGEFTKGLTALHTLLERNPEHVMGWAALGENYRKAGELLNAEKAYLQAYDLQPEAIQVLVSLGELAVERGGVDQARAYFQQAENEGSNDPTVAYQIAALEALAGRTPEALVWLEKSFQRGWSDRDALLNDMKFVSLMGTPGFDNLVSRYFAGSKRER